MRFSTVTLSAQDLGLAVLQMQMEIQAGFAGSTSQLLWGRPRNRIWGSSSHLKPSCSKRESQQNQNGDSNRGDKFSTDWDKAWSSFKKQGKKTIFSQFSLDKYVSWNPRPSNYPVSEETDPIKRTERSNLMLWTSPRFTLAGAIVVVSLLLVYTILAPV